jgi:RNA polymerase sigma-70 factor (ECF subfamily)
MRLPVALKKGFVEVFDSVDEPSRQTEFEATFLPHLSAAYNLARWLTRDGHDAEDVVQESYLRAFRSFDSFRGGDGRAWFLAVVRNTSVTWLQRSRRAKSTIPFDEALHGQTDGPPPSDDKVALRRALEDLPAEFREAIVLRDLEGLSYKEVAEVLGVPIGTIMSRLSRGRSVLRQTLSERLRDRA